MIALPDVIFVSDVVYGDGEDGAAFQIARNDDFGVQCDSARKDGRSRFVSKWSHDHIPGQYFDYYEQLLAAARNAEKQKPVVTLLYVKLKHEGSRGLCDLCRGPWIHDVAAKVGWRDNDVLHVSSCDDCLEATKADPVASSEARKKWVREHPITLGRPEPKDPSCPF